MAPNDQHPVIQLANRFGMLDPSGKATSLVKTLAATIMPAGRTNPNPEEITAFCLVALEYSLNPWTKEIYAFPAKGGGITPVVGVDGWLAIANRHPAFDGMSFEFDDTDDGTPIACSATIHRKDRQHPIQITEYYSECQRNTEPWKTMPHRMLRNRTICQSIRVAFSISGIYSPDEAEDFSLREAEYEVKEPVALEELLPPATVPEEDETTEEPEIEPDLTDPEQNPFLEAE